MFFARIGPGCEAIVNDANAGQGREARDWGAMPFTPQLDTLPSPQRALWPELATTPEAFTLYGGTALALRIGHRASVDFDFFSNASFDPERLAGTIPYLKDAAREAATRSKCEHNLP
jgi:hypothetical protein